MIQLKILPQEFQLPPEILTFFCVDYILPSDANGIFEGRPQFLIFFLSVEIM